MYSLVSVPFASREGKQGMLGLSRVGMWWQVVGPQQLCGNGLVEGLEECDDGNPNPGDGCSPTCQVARLLLVHLMLPFSCSYSAASLLVFLLCCFPSHALIVMIPFLWSPSHGLFLRFLSAWSPSPSPLLMLPFSCDNCGAALYVALLGRFASHAPDLVIPFP